MKWVFAFNQASEAAYGDFARVAVWTAQKNTDLEPICLYDGQPCELSHWLEARGVRVLPARFRLAHWWEKTARERKMEHMAQTALGAFLRFELVETLQNFGIEEDFVLYTDCDVMFEREVESLLSPLAPRYFAVAPETFQNNRLHMNSGAMWMNCNALRQENARFWAFAEKHMEQAWGSSFDQGIYRAYFNPPHRVAWKMGIPDKWFYALMSRVPLRTWKWDDLPLELNWKPYWGENSDAAILHFHGLKPTQRAALAAGTLPPNIAGMHNPFWEKCAAKWENLRDEARAG